MANEEIGQDPATDIDREEEMEQEGGDSDLVEADDAGIGADDDDEFDDEGDDVDDEGDDSDVDE